MALRIRGELERQVVLRSLDSDVAESLKDGLISMAEHVARKENPSCAGADALVRSDFAGSLDACQSNETHRLDVADDLNDVCRDGKERS